MLSCMSSTIDAVCVSSKRTAMLHMAQRVSRSNPTRGCSAIDMGVGQAASPQHSDGLFNVARAPERLPQIGKVERGRVEPRCRAKVRHRIFGPAHLVRAIMMSVRERVTGQELCSARQECCCLQTAPS